MTAEQRLERDLPFILDEIVTGPYPDYIDDVLSTTAHRRQRPGWTFPERWLPMELTTARVPMTRLPVRQLTVLALIAILIGAAIAVYIGSHQQRLPAPFGPAANGLIPYESEGDIYVGDPITGQTRLIAAGPERDWGPGYNLDGTKIGFLREVPLGGGVIGGDVYVVRPDGSELVRVTPHPIRRFDYVQWAPDGRLAVVEPPTAGDCVDETHCRTNELYFLAADGSGEIERLAGTTGADNVAFRPPDGRTILFRALVDGKFGLYSINVDGTDRRTVIEPRFGTEMDQDLAGAVYSADGSKIFYNSATAAGCCQLWTADADGTDQHVFAGAQTAWDGLALASPDGKKVAFWHHPNEGIVRGVSVAPADGSGPAVETGPVVSDTVRFIWSPDSSTILMFPGGVDTGSAFLLDPNGGPWKTVPWHSGPDLDWQRLAQPS